MIKKCPECGCTDLVKAGTAVRRKIGRIQRYQCVKCGLYIFGDMVTNG